MPTSDHALHIHNLCASIGETSVLSNITFTLPQGMVHGIMGKNGSGKSSLARTIMGDPAYQVLEGKLRYQKQNLLPLSVDKRAQLGLFLAFQNPCILPGVSVYTLLQEAYQAQNKKPLSVHEFQTFVQAQLSFLNMESTFLYRNVNEGFSGGEKKRLELLQLLVLQPRCMILDEIDSGLDIEAIHLVANTIAKRMQDDSTASALIITHNPKLFASIMPDTVHIMTGGTITYSGDASLLNRLTKEGYDAFK